MSYEALLRENSKSCDLHDDDQRILEHIIQTTCNTDLVCRVLNKKWTLKETFAEMQVLEDTSEQVEVMVRQNSSSFSKIGKRKKEKSKNLNGTRQKESNKTCKYCGKTHPMQKELCPAFYGKFCSKCGRPNHFSTVCMSSKETLRKRGNQCLDNRRDRRDVR